METDTTPVFARAPAAVLRELRVNPASGLDTREARRRRRRHGMNQLKPTPPKSVTRILVEQLTSLIVLLLSAAAAAALLFGHLTEAAAIFGVIVLNTVIGFITELRAVRSMEALRQLGVVMVNVRRGGRVTPIPARGLVPGDIVVLEAGDVASADLRLIEASKLECNEAILTGESLPVGKKVDAVEPTTPLPDRRSMVYLGSAITRGSGLAVVTGIGNDTELGSIAHLMETAKPGRTPLERRIDELSQQLMWVALALAAIVGISGILTGREVLLMIESAIALAVATVPEGLPMVATLALARGMWRMARQQALIERLAAVETLGATTVILTDKTGTLTENRMAVTRLVLASGNEVPLHAPEPGEDKLDDSDASLLERLVTVAVLCNNASLVGGDPVGDPMEVALLELADRLGFDREGLVAGLPELREIAFDPETKMMATIHRIEDRRFLYAVKGAPEAMLAAVRSTSRVPVPAGKAADHWQAEANRMAEAGLRVLALAGKTTTSDAEPPYQRLTLYGLVGLADPPRRDVAKAIDQCKSAGVRVVMVTGDHAATALNIGLATGIIDSNREPVVDGTDLGETLPDAPIFARVTPAQKLDILSAFQQRGEIVAMTGDGVNDAPALRKADIGIAMGQRGAQVAREAADMVLLDDQFGTIVRAIAQGRVIFGNIRKFVIYLMSCNVSELLTIGLASFSGAPLPLLPLQILYLNLVTDVFPAFALGAGEGEPDVMHRTPRSPDEPLLTRRHWREIAVGASVITLATLSAFALGLTVFGLPAASAVTLSFLTLALAQLWHVFNMRSRGSRLLANEITKNRFVWSAVGLCLLLIVAPVYLEPAARLLGLTPPPLEPLLTAVALSILPLVVGQLQKARPVRS